MVSSWMLLFAVILSDGSGQEVAADLDATVVRLFADLPERWALESVEPGEVGTGRDAKLYRFRSSHQVGRTGGKPLYGHAYLAVSQLPDSDSAAHELGRRLATADPDTGLSYGWDFLIASGDRVFHLHAECTMSEESFRQVISRLATPNGGSASPRSSFWCRCGAGCRAGRPGSPPEAVPRSLPLVRHLDPEPDDYDNRLDPSGSWHSRIGNLSLMHDANRLSFSYLAVFGPSAHICEGAGVAGLVGRDRYEYSDEQGTIAFVLAERKVLMEPVADVPSFCGSGWTGDVFEIADFEPPARCEVTADRASFRAVDHLEPALRPARAVGGDSIDAVAIQHTSPEQMILARLAGSPDTTVGLLRQADVTCP